MCLPLLLVINKVPGTVVVTKYMTELPSHLSHLLSFAHSYFLILRLLETGPNWFVFLATHDTYNNLPLLEQFVIQLSQYFSQKCCYLSLC